MSGRATGGAVESEREQQVEEDKPESMLPLMVLAVVKSHLDTLVWLQLCSPQGSALRSFVRLPPRVSRPFAGAPVYDMSLTHAERLRAVGSGFKGRLVRLLSLGMGRHIEPHRNRNACYQMMQSNVQHVASKLMAAVRDKAAKEAEELCASGQCAAAVVPLQLAVYLGDSLSRALKAWLLMRGREGVAQDRKRAFELAEEGARLGCHHCQGVMALCYLGGFGCEADEALSLELALQSSGRGSRYGQVTLGRLHERGEGGLAWDQDQYDCYAQAAACYRLAAVQGLDEAQWKLGDMHDEGSGVAQDYLEALRWYTLAAAQGYPTALLNVAFCHEIGRGVAADVAEAIRWYRRAQAAGCPGVAAALQRLLH